MSGSDMGMYLPPEIWRRDWPANLKFVFGYLWMCQGKNGCAWPFQSTMAAELKQPNLRTIQTAIAKLEVTGHLRKLDTTLRSRVAYQLRLTPDHDWPGITFDIAKKAKILPGQARTLCAAGDANPAQSSSSKLKRKNSQWNRPTPGMTYSDNTEQLFARRDPAGPNNAPVVREPSRVSERRGVQ